MKTPDELAKMAEDAASEEDYLLAAALVTVAAHRAEGTELLLSTILEYLNVSMLNAVDYLEWLEKAGK